MSVFQVHHFSESLRKNMPFHVILPDDTQEEMKIDNPHYKREMKTLYFYHGYTGTSLNMMLESQIQKLAIAYNLAVILPTAENSFYLNKKGIGNAYATYVGEELVNYVNKTFNLSDKKEDTFVAGISMGGFGAIHTGVKYPDTFGKIVALSSALVVNTLITMEPGTADQIADYDYYVSTFGDLKALGTSDNNPEYLVKKLKESSSQIPELYMACGTEDFLIEENREFYAFLLDQEVPVTYIESPGVHDWIFWDKYLKEGIDWLLDVKNEIESEEIS